MAHRSVRWQPRSLLLAVALAITACGEPVSTQAVEDSGLGRTPDDPGLALACWDVDEDQCRQAFTEVIRILPADGPPIVAASVVAFGCDNLPCAKGLGRGGAVSVEYANGGGLHAWPVSAAEDGSLTFGDHSTGLPEAFLPESPRMAQRVIDFSFGHCGLSSPIDVDGSFWDPIGQVDSDAPDAINSSIGTFSLVGPADAVFTSRTGFTVHLRRHQGARNLQGCD